MNIFKKNKPLTEKENVKFMSPPVAIPILIDIFSGKRKRKKRVVNLRTRMKLHELQIDPSKDHEIYHRIIEEEEKRFDERFKNTKQ